MDEYLNFEEFTPQLDLTEVELPAGFKELSPDDPAVKEDPINPPTDQTGAGDQGSEDIQNTDSPNEDEYQVDDDVYPSIANKLAEAGIIQDLPAGVDPEKFNADAFWKTIKHNFQTAQEKAYTLGSQENNQRLVNSLTPTTQSLLAYNLENPNLDEQDILDYMEAKIMTTAVTSLDPDNVTHAERIVTDYYKGENWKPEEVTEKLTELTAANLLHKEATRLKPKLVDRAEKAAATKVETQRAILQQEAALNENLKTRVIDILKQNNVAGVPLSQEDIGLLYHAILNLDVDVPLRGGKIAKMGLAEGLLYKHRYDQKGNLENLMLGILVMERGPEAILSHLEKKVQTKEVDKFINQHKFSASGKSGAGQQKVSGPDGLFRLNLKK